MILGTGTATILIVWAMASGLAAEPAEGPVSAGRFSVISEAGGAVWAFQPGGELVVVGPGDLVARGAWRDGPEVDDLDATLRVEASGQDLTIRVPSARWATRALRGGQRSDVARGLGALAAPVAPGGRPRGAVTTTEPSPTPPPLDCLRPVWASDVLVDWDRCGDADAALIVVPESSPAA
jgi:hypothetical protein